MLPGSAMHAAVAAWCCGIAADCRANRKALHTICCSHWLGCVHYLPSQVWLQALEPNPSTGLLPPPAEAEFPTEIRWLRLNASCLLLLGEGGRVFVQLGGADGSGEVVELR